MNRDIFGKVNMFSMNSSKQSKIAVGLIFTFFCMILLPLFIIAHYNYPCSDDFSFADALYKGISDNSGLKAVLRGAWSEAVQFYKSWQGCYFNNVLSSFGIGIAVPRYYFLGTYLVLISFVAASVGFLRTVTYRIGQWNSKISWIVSVLITAMQILYVPYPSEAFYWFVGATVYTLTYALLLFLVMALMCFYLNTDSKRKTLCGVLAIALTFMIGGSNYSTGLLTAEILVLSFGWMFLQKRKCLFLGIILAEYLICFVIFNAFAPGNYARMGAVESLGVAGSILASFRQGFRFLREWFRMPVVFLLIVIFLLGASQVAKMDFSFKLPGLVTFFSFGLFCSQMTPPFFAGATWGPGRLINLIYFSYYFLLAGNLLYWTGWLAKRCEKFRLFISKEPKVLMVLLCFFVLWVIGLKIYGLQSTNSTSAFLSLAKGEASIYLEENKARWAVYEDNTILDVEVEDFSVKPRVLYHDDIVEDSTDWRNGAVANFFGKNSVRLKR